MTRQRLELPTGSFEEITTSENYGEMHVNVAVIYGELQQHVLRVFGELEGRPLAEAVPQLCYSNVALTAYSMCSAANCSSDGQRDFDPVAFGKRCEEIAREQKERYSKRFELAGAA